MLVFKCPVIQLLEVGMFDYLLDVLYNTCWSNIEFIPYGLNISTKYRQEVARDLCLGQTHGDENTKSRLSSQILNIFHFLARNCLSTGAGGRPEIRGKFVLFKFWSKLRGVLRCQLISLIPSIRDDISFRRNRSSYLILNWNEAI